MIYLQHYTTYVAYRYFQNIIPANINTVIIQSNTIITTYYLSYTFPSVDFAMFIWKLLSYLMLYST